MLKLKLNRTAIALIAVVLMLSVFSMTAFAEDLLISPNPNAASSDGETVVTDEAVEETTGASESNATVEETNKASETNAETKAPTTGEDKKEEEKKGLTTGDIVSLAILGVVIIIVAIYCIKNREKVGKYFRSLRSEFKKIVWSPWNQVRKNTLVVIVVVVAIALIIGIADYIFSNGIRSLGNLL